MAASATSFATIIHLQTGHVVAAVTAAGAEPKLEDLAPGAGVRVRLPGTDGYVDVPASILVATRIAAQNEDVLDHPHDYVLRNQTLEKATDYEPEEGRLAVLVWRVETGGVSESVFDPAPKPFGKNGEPPRGTPRGAKQQLLAFEGGLLTITDAQPKLG